MQVQAARCPECGTSINESSAGKPCPACLMQLGLNQWSEQNGHTEFFNAQTIDPASGSSQFPNDISSLFPQLEILHKIGQGGMGTVYCAKQKSLDRLVALKVIKPQSQAERDFADRFVREARALAQLSHPNIVTVYDFGQTGDLYYFIMEYIDGINLRQMLHGGKVQPQQALAMAGNICDALQYAHDNGVVHRDIKPENILADTNGNVKIADFGLAKILNKNTAGRTLTQANQVMGTMHYMAPEQFERPLDVDHRADIYSLGVVIYELLTGELPLGRFAPPSRKVQVDVKLDEIVLQTLEKEPELRYQRASDVKSDMLSVNTLAPPKVKVPEVVKANAEAERVYVERQPVPPVKPPKVLPRSTKTAAKYGFWNAITSPQSYKNLIYLLLSFPLGIFYFVFIVVGLSVGLSTWIIRIGGFVLVGTFLMVQACLFFERQLARLLLGIDLKCGRFDKTNSLDMVERRKKLIADPTTWTGTMYLVGKFPLGIISFVCVVVFCVVPVAMIISPLAAIIAPNVEPFDMNLGPINFDSPSFASLASALGFLMVSGIGILLMFVSLHFLNGIAWLHVKWSEVCLGRRRRQMM